MVYPKLPFGGPKLLLDYLGRYIHRVAISNHRLLDIEHGKIRFHWKDYRHGSLKCVMTINAEFIRRCLLHVQGRLFNESKLVETTPVTETPAPGDTAADKPSPRKKPDRKTIASPFAGPAHRK